MQLDEQARNARTRWRKAAQSPANRCNLRTTCRSQRQSFSMGFSQGT